MTDPFVQAVATWWQTRHAYLEFAPGGPRQEQVAEAMADMWRESAHVPADNPLLQAVKAWSAMDARHVNDGAGPSGWRERKHLTGQLIDAINNAIDRDLETWHRQHRELS